MKIEISKHLSQVAPSVTLALAAKAAELKAAGVDVCVFTTGEPDFDTPQPILDAVQSEMAKGGAVFHYTPASGLPKLRSLVAEKFQRDNGLSYDPKQVLVSNGAKQVIFNAIAALVNEGDEVIVCAPYWVSYPEMVVAVGGKPVFVDCGANKNFAPSGAQIRDALSPRTKAIIINSPSNPSGAVFGREDFEGIYAALEGTNVVVISDEMYEFLVYDGAKHVSPAGLNEDAFARTLTVNGVSKAYAMTGWRIGYAAGPAELIKAMGNLQSHVTSNPASISQFAAMAALQMDASIIEEMRNTFDQRRKLMVDGLRAIDGIECDTPRGAFYAFPDISKLFSDKIPGSVAFSQALLEAEAVSVVPGAGFGSDNFIRLSYACSNETINEGLARLARFVASIR